MRYVLLSVPLGIGALLLLATAAPAAEPEKRPATVVVQVPADAKLTVDGHATEAKSATRWFESPPLASGKDYVYNFKAEFVRDGKTITVSKEVTVRAGGEARISLDLPGQTRYGAGNGSQAARVAAPASVAPPYPYQYISPPGPPGSNNPLSLGVGSP